MNTVRILPENLQRKFATIGKGGVTETLQSFQAENHNLVESGDGESQILVMIGSFGLIPDIFQFFGIEIETDPIDTNVTYPMFKEGAKTPVQW